MSLRSILWRARRGTMWRVASPERRRRLLAARIQEMIEGPEYGIDTKQAARAVALMMGIDQVEGE